MQHNNNNNVKFQYKVLKVTIQQVWQCNKTNNNKIIKIHKPLDLILLWINNQAKTIDKIWIKEYSRIKEEHNNFNNNFINSNRCNRDKEEEAAEQVELLQAENMALKECIWINKEIQISEI